MKHKHLNHETPHWVPSDADYFLTICAQTRNQNHFCHPEIGKAILHSVQFYNEKQYWFCHLVVLMPDHIHLVVAFPPDKVPARVVGLWKRWLAKSHAIAWQKHFFDHRLRNEENVQQKVDYILHNPVRAGLADKAEDWPYMWMPTA